MSREEAFTLISKIYSASLQINKNYTASDWQRVKKGYHFQKVFKIDLSKYTIF